MTPCGYTDSEWRRMGVTSISEVPAALERIRAEDEAKKGKPDLPAEALGPAVKVEEPTGLPTPEAKVEKPKPAKVVKKAKFKAKSKKKK